MNQTFLSRTMERYLQCRLAEDHAETAARFRPSLTVSRQCGAGMSRIGEELISYLDEVDDSTETGWALFDQSLVTKVIEDHKLTNSVEPFLTENTKFPIVDALEQLLNLHPSEWTLFNYTADTIRRLCHLGNSIIVGRAGNFITADLKNTFHVRLVGSKEKRTASVSEQRGISLKAAEDIVQEIDKSRQKFVKRHTGSDVNDPNAYHLVINTDNLPDKVLVRVLADSLLEWAVESEESRKVAAAELH
ncbi:MAG: cytidylate kinase-like family protein [Verrucomicrobiales bacterium]|nr:cytidylate kinase-like family protein [Verrucomicrobiales bacterium]